MKADKLKQAWAARNPRERLFLAVGGSAAAVLILVFGLLWPAVTEALRLREDLPRLRAQVETMRVQRQEVARLKGAPAHPALDPAQLRKVLLETAKSAGLGEPSRLDVGGGVVQLGFARVPFESWVGWLDALQREQHLAVDSARVEPTGEPGVVRVDAVLAGGG